MLTVFLPSKVSAMSSCYKKITFSLTDCVFCKALPMVQHLLSLVTFLLTNDRLTVFPHPDASPVITAIVSLSVVYM